jgi:hypothetical protein
MQPVEPFAMAACGPTFDVGVELMDGTGLINRIIYELNGHLHETPYNISVPKFNRWETLHPVPQIHLEVTYADDADDIIRKAGTSDPNLEQLRTQVRYKIDLKRHIAHVFIAAADSWS